MTTTIEQLPSPVAPTPSPVPLVGAVEQCLPLGSSLAGTSQSPMPVVQLVGLPEMNEEDALLYGEDDPVVDDVDLVDEGALLDGNAVAQKSSGQAQVPVQNNQESADLGSMRCDEAVRSPKRKETGPGRGRGPVRRLGSKAWPC